jgi:hypothetical protein
VAAGGGVGVFELALDVPAVALAQGASGDELVLDRAAGLMRVVAVAAVEEGFEADSGEDEVEVFGRIRHGVMLARLCYLLLGLWDHTRS